MRGIGNGRILLWISVVSILSVCSPAAAQTVVDCTGVNTSAYKTITAALAATATVGANIQVIAGPCNEGVNITGRYNLNLGAQAGKTVVINGMINIQSSANVYVYGFNVTNLSGNGIAVNDSHSVTLDTITSSGSTGHGLSVYKEGDVTILAPASFDNNGMYGISGTEHSNVDIETSTGALDLSNNGAGGLLMSLQSSFLLTGNSTIENDGSGPTGRKTGISLREGSSGELSDCTGGNLIQGQVHKGIEVWNTSQLVIEGCGTGHSTVIQNNGTAGAQVVLSSTLQIYGETQITGNPAGGILVDAGASLFVAGGTLISNNGTLLDIQSGGVVASNSSGVEVDGANVSSNRGWGFVAYLGGYLNLSGNTATGNEFGIIGCDSSSYVYHDFPPHSGNIQCATPSIPIVMPAQPLNGIGPVRPPAPKMLETEPHDPAAMAEKVRQARAAFWKAMRGARPQ